ncbi:hypothetical protein Tco_1028265 [Tanacetum coccineum]|uniref:Uncharacterized protein n=1 Tax=Tanacetum coccineum TaxID=301880 RepID=A0ABQ5G042_9ASTR
MDLYHSQLTPYDLNDLIIKYKIPRDLHHGLPSEDFVMSKLSDDAIGSTSLSWTLCKQGDWFSFTKRRAPSPRHLNAAIDDPRPAAGSFNMADVRRLSAHVIKLRDMPEDVLVLSGLSQVWKSRICDPVLRGADGNVIGIHDFLCLPEWTGAEIQEEPYFDVRSTLQRLPFYCTPLATADAVILDPTIEDLAAGTPSSKILAKAKASQKRKASTFGATSGHVAKRTRSALAQSSGSTTHHNLFVGGSNDESNGGACVEIPLVTLLHSRGKGIMVDDAAAPSGGASRPRPSSRPAPSFKDVSGDAIHTDFFPFSAGPYYATYPKGGVAGNYKFTHEEWDAPYRPTFGVLTKEVFKDHVVCKTLVDQFPTPGEMVQVKSLSDDQLTTKMSVLHCMMMSHDGELLAHYRGLNQSHQEYLLSADSRLKGYEEKAANMTGLELQVAALNKQVYGLNDKLTSSDASFAKSKAKGKERKKKIKSLSKSMDNLHVKLACLSAALNQATILKAERDEEILRLKTTPLEFSSFFQGQFQGLVQKFLASDEFSRVQHGLSMHRTKDEFAAVLKKIVNFMPDAQERLLEPKKLVHLSNVPTLRDARVSPPVTKELIVTPPSKSLPFLELSANVDLTTFVVASEHNEEMVNAEFDGSNPKMTDDTITAKFGHAFVQDMTVVLDDAVELVGVGSWRVSSSPNDVVVALSTGEEGDGLAPSFVAGEEAVVDPYRV